MKKILASLCLISGALMMSACDNSKPVTAEDLAHNRFALVKVNNENVAPEKQTFIEFGENMMVNGKMCNRFFGKATIENSVLTSPGFAMTRMICGDDEQLNKLDGIINEMFRVGAKADLSNDSLKLTAEKNQLVFERQK